MRLAAVLSLAMGASGAALAQTGPLADFSTDVRIGAVPFTVNFTDLSSGTITNWIWSFGDGAISNATDAGVSHTYVAAGTNTVQLIVQGPDGEDTNTQPDYIVVASCPPLLVSGPASLNFGSVAVGSCSDRIVTVINTGCMNLDGDVSADWPFSVTAGSPFSVAPGETNLVTISFCPPVADNYGGVVHVNSDGGSSTIPLSALAIAPASLLVSPASYDFGFVATGRAAQTVFLVANPGEAALAGTVAVGGAFAIIGDGSINLAGHCATNILVSFEPDVVGEFSNDVVFASNGGGSVCPVIGVGAVPLDPEFVADVRTGQIPFMVAFTDLSTGDITNRLWSFGDGTTINATDTNVSYTYTSTGAMTVQLIIQGPVGMVTNTQPDFVLATNCVPQLYVSGEALDFGALQLGQSSQRTITIVNTGCLTLNGSATVGEPFFIEAGSPFTMEPGGTNSITVRFDAEPAGEYLDAVVITSDGGSAMTSVHGLASAPPMLGVSPVSYDFGLVVTGQTAQTDFTVVNLGDELLVGTTSVSSAFAVIGNGSFTLSGHASTNITIGFSPLTMSSFDDNVVFTSNGGDSANLVSGVGADVPAIDFASDIRAGKTPLVVTFTEISSGMITNRLWSFGDGTTSNTMFGIVSHTYTSAGTYSVQLIAQRLIGAATNMKTDYIVVTNCPPQIFVAQTELDFGTIITSQTNDMQLTVMNIGCLTLTGSVVVGGPFEVLAGTPFTLAAGETNAVTIRFLPPTAGEYENRVSIISDGGTATSTVAGIALPMLDVSPATHDFGAVAVGQTSQAVFVVTNRGEMALAGTATVSGIFAIVGNGAFALAPHQASNIVIRFAPLEDGSANNDVVFASDCGTSTNPVTGAGAHFPRASFAVDAQTGQIPFTVNFTDYSIGTITNRIWSFGDGTMTSTTDLNLSHTYMSAGTNTVLLIVEGPLGSETNIQRDLIFATNCPSQLAVSPLLWEFGSVIIGHTREFNLTVQNAGCLAMVGEASVADPFAIVTGSAFNLSSGASSNIIVSFQPQSRGGFTNELAITSEGGNATIVVTGVGLDAPRLMVSPDNYDFGIVATGQSVQTSFVVTNQGESILTGTTIVCGAFSVIGDGSFNLDAGQTTNIVIGFLPLVEGVFSNSAIFTSSGGDSTNPVTGVGMPPLHADFVADVRTGQVPFVVTFTDCSTGPVTNRNWLFGDGSTSNTANTMVSHTYVSTGMNAVQLIVDGPPGADTNIQPDFIVATNCPSVLSVSVSQLNFGAVTVGTSNELKLALVNLGCESLNGTASGGGPFVITGGSPFNNVSGVTNLLAISFRPMTGGGFTNSIVIISDGGSTTCGVTGVALTPSAMGVNPQSYDFGTIETGRTVQAVFVVTNYGESALSGVAMVDSPFSVISGGSFVVAGRGTTNIVVEFAPQSGGTFATELVLTSKGGDFMSLVTGNGAIMPHAYFSANVRTGQVPFAVTFTDLSHGTITGRLWSFGDGVTSNTAELIVTHVYSDTGSHAVRLITQGPLGSDTNIQPAFIVATNCPPLLLASPITSSFGLVDVGQSNDLDLIIVNMGCMTMTGAATVGGPFVIANGNPFNVASGETNRITVSFRPQAVGRFTNEIVITSNGGVLTNLATGLGSSLLHADFMANVRTGEVPLAVTFTDHSIGVITNRSWSFGDGGASNTMSSAVSHVYAAAGTYTVQLLVEDPINADTNIQMGFIVATNCPPLLSASPALLNFGTLVAGESNDLTFLIANVGCEVLTGEVNIGGPFVLVSGSSFEMSPGETNVIGISFRPVIAGGYTNQAVVMSGGGSATSTVIGVALSPAVLGVSPVYYDFGVVATGQTAQTCLWVTNYGDSTLSGTITAGGPFAIRDDSSFTLAGHGSTNIIVTFTPSTEGQMSQNVVFDSNGGEQALPFWGVGAIMPHAAFEADVWTGQIPFIVIFTDQSSGTITNRRWEFGDGESSSVAGTVVQHVYTSVGTNTVQLIVQGPLGTSTNDQIGCIVCTNCQPRLSIAPDPLDFGRVQPGLSSNLTLAVANDGCMVLHGWASVGGPFTVVNGSPFDISPGATNLVEISFLPMAYGIYSNKIMYACDALTVTGTVMGAVLTPQLIGVNPTNCNFGVVVTGQTAQISIAITNIGDSLLTGTTVVSGVFSVIGDGSFSLAGHGATNVLFGFTPPTEGAFGDWVTFSSDGGELYIPVSGVGAVIPLADFVADIHTGEVPLVVAFTDTSTGIVTNRFWSFGDETTSNATGKIVAHTYWTTGTNTVQLIVDGIVGADTNAQVGLIVVTNCPPSLLVDTSPLDFGIVTVGRSSDLSIAVANIGCLNLKGSAAVGGAFAIVSETPFSIAPSVTNYITIRFQPLTSGGFTNEFDLMSDGGSMTGTVIGMAITPAQFAVTPADYDFGVVATGQAVQTAFIVTNLGESTLMGTTTVGGAFAVIGDGSFSMAGYGVTNILISFAPISDGTFSNNVIFTSNGGGATNPVTGTGSALLCADFAADIRTGQVPLVVTFTDMSTGIVTNRYWSFGDGASSNTIESAVTHTFTNTGVRAIQLVVQGPLGQATNSRTDFIVITNCPAQLAIDLVRLDFGQVSVPGGKSLDIMVSNMGCEVLTGEVAVGGPFAIVSGSPFAVDSGAITVVTIDFAPQSEGGYTNNFIVISGGGNATGVVTGVGMTPPASPILGVSPTNFDFGIVAAGHTAQMNITVTNSGGGTLAGVIYLSGAFSVAGNAVFSVDANAATNILINFTPPNVGAFNEQLFVVDSTGYLVIPVTGIGALIPHADFVADVRTGQVPFSVTFTDLSTGTITNRVWSFGDGAASNVTGAIVSHAFTVTGIRTVQLIAQGPVGADTNTQLAYITATNCPPQLFVNPTSLVFGPTLVGESSNLRLAVVNTGCLTLTGSASFDMGAQFAIADGSSFSIDPGATNVITISFQPYLQGACTSEFIISSDGGTVTGAVSGVALLPASVGVSPAGYDFGPVLVGTYSDSIFVVTNYGDLAAAGTVTVGSAFAIIGDPLFNLAPHDSTNITVRFSPQGYVSYTDSVTFASTGGTIANEVTGRGVMMPVLPYIPDQTIPEMQLMVMTNAQVLGDIQPPALTYAILDAPAGMHIDPIYGVISWTPDESQGPGTGIVTTVVIAEGMSALAATNSFAVYVREVNRSPSLASVSNRVVSPGDFVTVTNVASDPDQPANVLTFSLVNSPGDMQINPISGVLTWTPDASVAGISNTITVRVTDDGLPPLSADTTFRIYVRAPAALGVTPSAYAFGFIVTGQSVQATFVVTNLGDFATSGSAEIGGTFEIVGNASFNLAAHGSSNLTVRFAPVATGVQSYDLTFASTVESPAIPVTGTGVPTAEMPLLDDQTVPEMQLMVVANAQVSAGVPPSILSYALLNAPAGMLINPTNGVISWAPDEGQGPGTYTVTTVVGEASLPPVAATNSFTVYVTEVNRSPVFAATADRSVYPLALLSVTNVVADPDIPANAFTFSLVSAPPDALLDRYSGVFTWMPTADYFGTTNTVTVHVDDDGQPSLGADMSFNIFVVAPDVQFDGYRNGAVITWPAAASPFVLESTTNITGDATWDIVTNSPAGGGPMLMLTNRAPFYSQFFRLRLP